MHRKIGLVLVAVQLVLAAQVLLVAEPAVGAAVDNFFTQMGPGQLIPGMGKNPFIQNPLSQNPLGQNPLGQNPLGQNPLDPFMPLQLGSNFARVFRGAAG